ncbi:MAG: 16S rRNA (guanine(966)-N(2))-methyltransferase RsmD [Hyphomicrobiales bacterium]
MRIVGGKFRGHKLAVPKSDSIRPTTDRSRESLFNILNHRDEIAFDDARVIDLFAGTGALGLEALSRGASFALFLDESAEARGLVRTNMESCKQNGNAKIFRRDATRLGKRGTMSPFTLAFLDPPYDKGLGERALQSLHEGEWLAPEAFVVWEESTKAEVIIPAYFTVIDDRTYGTSRIKFLTYQP